MAAPRILIVDREAHHPYAIPAMMKRSWLKGWEVEFAADAEEAVALVRTKAFDLVCVNLYLAPERLGTYWDRIDESLAGQDVSEEVYAHGVKTVGALARAVSAPAHGRKARIVAWSYYALPEHAKAARKAGACEVVECRMGHEPLRVALEKWCRRAKAGVRQAA